MDFCTSARVTFHGATEWLRLDHTYPAQVKLHIDRRQSILESFRALQPLRTPDNNTLEDGAPDENTPAPDENVSAPDENAPENAPDENLDRWIATFEEILQ